MNCKKTVQKALRKIWEVETKPRLSLHKFLKENNSLVSKLINDIFGGEILKTPVNKGWYFYNCIDGERIDLTNSLVKKSMENNPFKDIPSTQDEVCKYFDNADYSTFFMRFVKSFEETVGLKKHTLNY